MDPVAAWLEPFRARPRDAAVLLDYDGTLSPIVLDPAKARPLGGAADALVALHQRCGQLAVVSGRPVEFLAQHLPDELTIYGLYGLEQRREGHLIEHPEATGWRDRIAEVVAAAHRDVPDGVEVESKGLSLTLHFRRHPELAEAAGEWATTMARDAGLEVRPAKKSLELHPPVAVDKGTVVESVVGGLAQACYLGDDEGDLAAFDGLDRVAERGCKTLALAVTADESSPELLARADATVAGPAGVLAFLRSLVA